MSNASIRMLQSATGPATPASGYTTLWAGTDDEFYVTKDTGVVTPLAGTSGISGTSGIDGTSGINGTSGISGTSGVNGSSGVDGTSGINGTSGVNGSSGVDGTSGISGTSGVDGTSGISGTSGVDGTSGISGTSGVDGSSGAPSPIIEVATDTLVSTAIGATASGATGAIVIGRNAFGGNSDYTIIIGECANNEAQGDYHIIMGHCAEVDASNLCNATRHIVIGACAKVCQESDGGMGRNIVIGPGACTFHDGGNIAIGSEACAVSTGGYITSRNNTAVGFRSRAVQIGSSTYGTDTFSCGSYGAVFGAASRVESSLGTVFGSLSTVCTNASNSIIVGDQNISCNCNTITIGSTLQTRKIGQIQIGYCITVPTTSIQCSIYIGNEICPGGGCASANLKGQVMIGWGISQNEAEENCLGSVLIGTDLQNNHQNGVGSDPDVMIGQDSCIVCSRGNNTLIGKESWGGGSQNTLLGYYNRLCATDSLSHAGLVMLGAGNAFYSSNRFSTAVGWYNRMGSGCYQVSIGGQSGTIACQLKDGQNYSTFIGTDNEGTANKTCTNILGAYNCITQSCTGIFGNSSCAGHTGAFVIGNSLTSKRENTVHVQHIVSEGQGASNIHPIGSTGGASAVVDWNNGNNQTVTLTDNTTFAFCNPLPGANYSLILTQGGSGSYSVTWPASVKWAGATGPTLSTAIGDIDMTAFVYDGTNYFGSSACNFA